MRRREFIKQGSAILAVPVIINGLPVRAMARSAAWQYAAAMGNTDRVLVVIQLEGGNDSLNTFIPVDDAGYYNARPVVAIPKQDALPLDGMPLLRCHPAIGGLQRLFNEGTLALVGNIGYPFSTMSHFAGTEIWNTGSGSQQSEYLRTGWLGRLLSAQYPEYPDTIPADPPAIEISGATSSAFTIVGSSISMSLTDPAEFYELVNGGPRVDTGTGADTPASREKSFIDGVDQQSRAYAETIKRAAGKAANIAEYPAGNKLAASLAIIARLVAGGLGTRVYKVSLGNFDTHFNQQAGHAALLKMLSEAVAAFQQDLGALGVADRVVGMTYSEFGRRVASGGDGTDHGAASAHMVFGAMVDGGRLFGGMPNLAELDASGNLKHTIDFHCYYASVVAPLFGLSPAAVDAILPIGACEPAGYVPLYRAASAPREHAMAGYAIQAFPSVTAGRTSVTITAPRHTDARLRIIDAAGREAAVAFPVRCEPGTTAVPVDLTMLPQGEYLLVLESGQGRVSTRAVVAR